MTDQVEQRPEGEYAWAEPETCVICGDTILPDDQPRWVLPHLGGSAHDGCYDEDGE